MKDITIKEFQDRIFKTYYAKDKTRGKEQTFMWFVEEVGELARSLNKDNNLDNRYEEFSDVLAWLFSLANLYNIDMQKAASRYINACPKCGKSPCICK